jgi:hypothetical protein
MYTVFLNCLRRRTFFPFAPPFARSGEIPAALAPISLYGRSISYIFLFVKHFFKKYVSFKKYSPAGLVRPRGGAYTVLETRRCAITL